MKERRTHIILVATLVNLDLSWQCIRKGMTMELLNHLTNDKFFGWSIRNKLPSDPQPH